MTPFHMCIHQMFSIPAPVMKMCLAPLLRSQIAPCQIMSQRNPRLKHRRYMHEQNSHYESPSFRLILSRMQAPEHDASDQPLFVPPSSFLLISSASAIKSLLSSSLRGSVCSELGGLGGTAFVTVLTFDAALTSASLIRATTSAGASA